MNSPIWMWENHTSYSSECTVAPIVFSATTLYKPDISAEFASNISAGLATKSYFVFWKTDNQPDHIPKWEDPGVPAEVMQAWRLNEARKLAIKRAGELKDEAAANSSKSLAELASSKKKDFTVLRPLPFSFWTERLRLGDVFGLDKVGPGFTQKAFSLKNIGDPPRRWSRRSCKKCSAWPRTKWE